MEKRRRRKQKLKFSTRQCESDMSGRLIRKCDDTNERETGRSLCISQKKKRFCHCFCSQKLGVQVIEKEKMRGEKIEEREREKLADEKKMLCMNTCGQLFQSHNITR